MNITKLTRDEKLLKEMGLHYFPFPYCHWSLKVYSPFKYYLQKIGGIKPKSLYTEEKGWFENIKVKQLKELVGHYEDKEGNHII